MLTCCLVFTAHTFEKQSKKCKTIKIEKYVNFLLVDIYWEIYLEEVGITSVSALKNHGRSGFSPTFVVCVTKFWVQSHMSAKLKEMLSIFLKA